MDIRDLAPADRQALEKVLGYLNFSAGKVDPGFLANLNQLFEVVASQALPTPENPLALLVGQFLREGLQQLSPGSAVFSDAAQAEAVLRLVFDEALPAYREFHKDLLFNHTPASLFRPFFVGRMCEAVLRQGGAWDEPERIVSGAIRQLNDYVGYRPVPVLESRRIEPYPHEFVRPIPLFIAGAGIAFGPEAEVVAKALELLRETDDDILRRAFFDPEKLEELAVDPRAYDFDHPANKRPNYHFGQWDPHHIDNRGYYRRFVVQQVTLEALLRRLDDVTEFPREEIVFEAASVLAGTILMASGVSGEGPSSFDSNTCLSRLLTPIARYRDEFYERLFSKTSGRHADRLRKEMQEKRQPFGGARQHLNAQLARQRASQLEHLHLAAIFARMGFLEASRRQVDVVPCAAVRMRSEIECELVTGRRLIERRDVEPAALVVPAVINTLRRGIECGAFVDPWNILGFDAQFSLFPAPDNAVHDHRVDELLDIMDGVFTLLADTWSEAAACDNTAVAQQVSQQFDELARWWHKFAAHEVSNVESVDSMAVYRAAERVAKALHVWHRGGAAAGDVAFWAPYAEMFDSPKAYVLVIDALLKHNDYVASMALLVHWLSQADAIPLERADCSFHELAIRWMVERTTVAAAAEKAAATWEQTRKFFDYLEANAESHWHVPQFEIRTHKPPPGSVAGIEEDEESEEDRDNLLDAAYEDMVYRDSTDDGVRGEIFENDDTTHDELMRETRRVANRLSFLQTLAELWRLMAVFSSPGKNIAAADDEALRASQRACLDRWAEMARHNVQALQDLMDSVREFKIPTPTGNHDSLIEYDRRRVTKESLLERIISTIVETAQAGLLLESSAAALAVEKSTAEEGDEPALVAAVCGALFRNDLRRFRKPWKLLISALASEPLLYVPLTKGGDPRRIVAVRIRQHVIQHLLLWLPRRGLWAETCQLLEVAREMERSNPVGPGAVTEFDELFKIGYKALVESLVASVDSWPATSRLQDEETLVAFLEQLTESLLSGWLAHSRTLRLSVMEKVHESTPWKKVVAFVQTYGEELFSQRFLNLANIRAILHQGVDRWLESLEKVDSDDVPEKLLAAIEAGELTLEDADEQLSVILEAVIENYGEYRDYNSTTTQSDRGEMLYTLLDFLRLRTRYDRVCWNLKPVILAHEILVRRGHSDAARIWHHALEDRISDEAAMYLRKLAELQKKYAMRMPTVADRLAERFTRPLAVDRIRALVIPALEEGRQGGRALQFELLEEETATLTAEPTGVGLDVPAWLAALEEEVELASRPIHERVQEELGASVVPQVKLKAREVRKLLEKCGKNAKPEDE